MSKHYVYWEVIDDWVEKCALNFKNEKFSGVYGIPRGGLVLAVMLSHKMGIPLLMAPAKNCLVVDDIADTGLTLQHYDEKNYAIATVFYHEQSVVKPSFALYTKTDDWIVFPWEEVDDD